MPIRNYKYLLYDCKGTKKLSTIITSSNFAWNHIIQFTRRYYRMYHKGVSLNMLQKHMAKLRKKDPFWCKLGSQTMQDICQKYTDSLNAHFRQGRGFPKVHKKFGNGSILFKQGVGYKLDYADKDRVLKNGRIKKVRIGILTVNAIGNIKFKFKVTRQWGEVRTVRIKRDLDGRLYLIIASSVEINDYKPKDERGHIGMDFGLKTFLTLSDGSRISIPDFNKRQHAKTVKADRSYSKKRSAGVYGTNFKRARKAKFASHRKEKTNVRISTGSLQTSCAGNTGLSA